MIPRTGLTRSVSLTFALIATVVCLQAESSLIGGQLIPPILTPPPSLPNLAKLDPLLQARVSLLSGQSRIIATAPDGVSLDALALLIQQSGGIPGRRLAIVNSVAATVP